MALKNRPGRHQMCTRTVMDTTDPDITFDEAGVCNWWHEFHQLNERWSNDDREELRESYLCAIKEAGKNRQYDCILGLSGGVDSSYLAFLAREWGLRPLVVHFDNGWNDELAVRNIENVLNRLGFNLHTFVMNWLEFRDLQRSYFLASVLDLDVPADHMIAAQHRIKYILSGNNTATEWLLPRAWYYSKSDLQNLMNIHRRFGNLRLRHLPKLGVWQSAYYRSVRGIEVVEILELVPYRKLKAKQFLEAEMNWSDYGGKHYESVFTRFYQAYILPRRYGIDKRKAHLSNLICNDEISRDQALEELAKPADDPDRVERDKRYVAKKLGWSDDEFEEILSLPPVDHEKYGDDAFQIEMCRRVSRCIKPIGGVVRKVFRV